MQSRLASLSNSTATNTVYRPVSSHSSATVVGSKVSATHPSTLSAQLDAPILRTGSTTKPQMSNPLAKFALKSHIHEPLVHFDLYDCQTGMSLAWVPGKCPVLKCQLKGLNDPFQLARHWQVRNSFSFSRKSGKILDSVRTKFGEFCN